MRGLEFLCLAATAAALAWLLCLWARMAVSPAPQEMREAAPLLTTLAFLQGRNPYALATLPGPANLYGPLYPLLAVPFAWILGPGLVAMRAANAAALIGATLLLYRCCRREGGGVPVSLLASALTLAGWLYWVGPTVRPDGVGLLLMLAACAIFTRRQPSWRGFVPCLAISLMAFTAKIYFVFPALVAAAWTFLSGRFALGLAFGATALAGLATSVVMLSLLLPGWPAVVLGASLGATEYNAGHLLRQLLDWMVFSLPLLAGTGAVLVQQLSRRPGAVPRGVPSFWSVAALAGLAALLASLGGHTGAHMTYFFHLLSPFAAVALAGAAGRSALPRRAMAFAFPIAILASAHWFPRDFAEFARGEAGFATARTLIAAAALPLATTEFAPLLIAAGHAAPENGHSEYFAVALAHPPPAFLAWLWPSPELLAARAAQLDAGIREGLERRDYDLVLTNPFGFGLIPRPLLEAHYVRTETLPVAMPWASQAWAAEIWRRR